MHQSPPIERRAWAKLNLALSVAPPDETGMHPICSWMTCVDVYDTVRITRLGEGEASEFDLRWADGSPVAWDTQTDLGARAHALLEREAGRRLPVRVELRKSIPAGGGLGGGSSDGACVMRTIDELFGLGLGAERLAALSRELGSDVAFFLDERSPARPAIVTGLGERVERLAPISGDVTLVCPPFGCKTGRVYRAYDDAPAALREPDVRALAGSAPDPARLFNDLASAAERVEPRLGELRAYLSSALGLPVHVSGSGSTLFVLGPEGTPERVRLAAPSCRTLPTRFV